jgi:hypothetical protein
VEGQHQAGASELVAVDIELSAKTPMDKIAKITAKYNAKFLRAGLSSLGGLKRFALDFYKDVAKIHDRLARVKNVKPNPTRFSLVDAPRRTRYGEA